MKINIHSFITSRSFLLRMKNVSYKSCGENKNIYRVSINSFPDYKHLLQASYVEYKYFFFKM